MQPVRNHIYYNPFDPHCWGGIAIGLPLLLAALALFGLIGWWAWGLSAAAAPVTWLHRPQVAVGLAVLGIAVSAIALGIIWTVGLIAHAIGRGVLDGLRSAQRRRRP